MKGLKTVCGQWLFENGRWMFHVDNRRGTKVILVDDNPSFEDLIKMVYGLQIR